MTNLQTGQKFLYKNTLFEITQITLETIKGKSSDEEILIKTSYFVNNLNNEFILQ